MKTTANNLLDNHLTIMEKLLKEARGNFETDQGFESIQSSLLFLKDEIDITVKLIDELWMEDSYRKRKSRTNLDNKISLFQRDASKLNRDIDSIEEFKAWLEIDI